MTRRFSADRRLPILVVRLADVLKSFTRRLRKTGRFEYDFRSTSRRLHKSVLKSFSNRQRTFLGRFLSSEKRMILTPEVRTLGLLCAFCYFVSSVGVNLSIIDRFYFVDFVSTVPMTCFQFQGNIGRITSISWIVEVMFIFSRLRW